MNGVMRKNIQDIYFFEVNTKYISSNVLETSVIYIYIFYFLGGGGGVGRARVSDFFK